MENVCPHLALGDIPRPCTAACIPAPPKVAKPKKVKPKPKVVAPVDPEERRTLEFAEGRRCMLCSGLRVGAAMQCECERAAIVARNIEEVSAWAEANSGGKGKLVQTAAAGAIGRITLRGGLRNAPSSIEGLSQGGLVSLASRTVEGRSMEWSRDQRSGDPLPV